MKPKGMILDKASHLVNYVLLGVIKQVTND